MALSQFQAERVRAWLEELRGDQSQEDLADAINETLPDWHITRDRYSRYESGSLPMGPTVLANFIRYWELKGKSGPDLEPPAPAEEPEDPQLVLARAIDRQAAAMERQNELMADTARATPEAGSATLADAIKLLVTELQETRRERQELSERLAAVEARVRLLGPSDDATLEDPTLQPGKAV